MSITASGLYGLSLEKAFIDTLGESFEAEDNKVLLVTDSYTPNFGTHDFRDDLTNEVSGTGYSAGGSALTGTELTHSGGVMTFDATDVSWASSTITDAMALVHYFNVGSAGTDPLGFLLDFVNVVSSSSGTLSVVFSASGIWTLDYTP